MTTSKITIHAVSSLDGFIAKKDGSVDWMQSMDNYEKGTTLTDEQIVDFLNSIDCYVMGSHTYEHALELGWPYGEVPVFVLTSRNLTTDRPNVQFYSGDLENFVNKQLKPNYHNIWVVGGAIVFKEFIRLRLANEIVLSIMPVILGDGLLFLDYVGQHEQLHLKEVTAYKDGIVELVYEIVRK